MMVNITFFNCLLFFCSIFPLISFCEKIKIDNSYLRLISKSFEKTQRWDRKEMIFTTLPSSKIISMKNLSNLSGSIDQDLFLNNQTKDKIENIKIHYSKPVEFVNIGKSENYYGKVVYYNKIYFNQFIY